MRALVLSGGGSRGAWQAGALEVLCEAAPRYALCCGVSVGALGAAHFAQYAPGEEARAARDLVRVWEAIRTRDVRRPHRPFGLLHGLWRPSFYDARPLARLVRGHLDPARLRASGRDLIVGAVSVETGAYRLFRGDHPRIVDAVLASAAFPAMLDPVSIDGALFTDGGLREVTPLKAAIDAGATEVDVLLAHPPSIAAGPLFAGRRPTAVALAARALEILLDEVVENDLAVASRINALVRHGGAPRHRHVALRVLRPTAALPGSALSFRSDDVAAMLEQGRGDARRALAREAAEGPTEP